MNPSHDETEAGKLPKALCLSKDTRKRVCRTRFARGRGTFVFLDAVFTHLVLFYFLMAVVAVLVDYGDLSYLCNNKHRSRLFRQAQPLKIALSNPRTETNHGDCIDFVTKLNVLMRGSGWTSQIFNDCFATMSYTFYIVNPWTQVLKMLRGMGRIFNILLMIVLFLIAATILIYFAITRLVNNSTTMTTTKSPAASDKCPVSIKKIGFANSHVIGSR